VKPATTLLASKTMGLILAAAIESIFAHQTLYSYFFSQLFPETFTLNLKPKKGEQDGNKQILDHCFIRIGYFPYSLERCTIFCSRSKT
jgi:hypothetical protein